MQVILHFVLRLSVITRLILTAAVELHDLPRPMRAFPWLLLAHDASERDVRGYLALTT
jgi:hypothetical protein